MYQALPRIVAYGFAETPKRRAREATEAMMIPLGIDETYELCNSFILVAKPNGNIRLCLDPPKLNKALIRSIYRGPTLDDIIPRLAGMKYIMSIDVSTGYHNLKLDDKLSYLIIFHVHLPGINM